ncbi:APC family permease [Reyranella massiliensis]|uniref:APC family permease n=1 Tax=Reyranella massiliensis TaxID=445220 RepID=UPI0002FA9DF7|nr:APC family permease [Reyranella massiliensis]
MTDIATPVRHGTMRLWSVAALGIGSMVGAGIFALLGQAALMAGSDVYLSFAIGGVIALLSGYSYARLAARFPSSAGIMDYFDRAYPSRIVAGGLSVLYLVTSIIAIAMIAKTFGAYADRLFLGDTSSPWVKSAFASAIVIALVAANMVGSGAVGRLEELLVVAKLVILAVLMIAGVPAIDPALLVAGPTVGAGTLLASVGLTFFAYAGYGMMTNAAGHVAHPEVTIPRAIYLAIGLVIVLYIGLAIVVLGSISPAELARYADTAVAQAARPVLGQAGFVIVAGGALFATASAINACIFSALEVSRGLAARGQLPATVGRAAWGQGTHGLVWGAGAILILVSLFDLGAIAQVAGATFLISYLAIFLAHWRLHAEVGGRRSLILLGAALMALTLGAFTVSLLQTQPIVVALALVVIAGSFGIEWLVQRRRWPSP